MTVSLLGVLALTALPLQQGPAADTTVWATEALPLEPTREIAFTTDEGSWISVDLSPDGETLVFDLLVGLESELGSLEPGKLADLVIFSGNPLDDIHETGSVTHVMMNGRLFEAGTLDEVWPRQRALPFRGFVTDEPEIASGGGG